MLRDTRRGADYFKGYINYQNARIEKFEAVLQKIVSEGGDETKESQCHMYLVNFYQDLLFAEYSYGCDISQLRKTYMHYLSHSCAQNTLTYDTALNVLSWMILLDVKNSTMLDESQFPKDGLLVALFQYLEGNWPLHDLEKMFALLPSSEPFLHCLMGKLSPEELKTYIQFNWYESNKDSAWYGSDKREDETYCGYWCLVGAAVIKMMHWNPCLFEGTVYCPIDLLF